MIPIPISRLFDEFLQGYEPPARAPSTCRLMRQTIRELSEDSSIQTSADLSPAALWRWLRRYPDRSPMTAALHLRNARVLCNHAVGRGFLVGSPFTIDAKLKKATHARRVVKKRHHSLTEIGCVLGHLRDRWCRSKEWEDHRLYALASVAAFTGARALEVSFAEVKDFDLSAGWFTVEPKINHRLKTDGSEREIPIPPPLAEILTGWLPRARSRWAFPGIRRLGPWYGGSEGYRPLDQLKQAGLEVGVRGFTFLSLRHSYVTHGSGPWGLGPGLLRLIAGHTTEDTQGHYLGRDREDLKTAVEAIAFPMPTRLAR